MIHLVDIVIVKHHSPGRKDLPPGGALTERGTSLGTPAYMAPEQVAGEETMDHRVDIYAWGMLAHELLAGRHPFAGKSASQLLVLVYTTPKPRTAQAFLDHLAATDPVEIRLHMLGYYSGHHMIEQETLRRAAVGDAGKRFSLPESSRRMLAW